VCNGVQNCPNASSAVTAGSEVHHDESPDLCKSHIPEQVNWLAIALGATGGAVVATCLICMLCRACHKRDDDEPY
jgi:hypothetical protein